MRIRVLIIGGRPSDLLFPQLLHHKGIDTIVLERKTCAYVPGRIRAVILEPGFADLMGKAQVGAPMDQESFTHEGTLIASGNEVFRALPSLSKIKPRFELLIRQRSKII